MKRKTRAAASSRAPLPPSPERVLPLQALCGAGLGLIIASVKAADVSSRLSRSPWPAAAAPRLESLARLAGPASWLWGAPLALVGLLVFVIAWTQAARSLNPGVPPFPFAKARPKGLAWAVVLLSGAALLGGEMIWTALCDLARVASRSPDPLVDFLHVLPLAAAGGSLAWLIVSPAGWAGNLEEWRDPLAAAPRSWPRLAGLGAAYGAALAVGAQAFGALSNFLGALDAEVWHAGVLPRDGLVMTLVSAVLGALAMPAAWSLAAALAPDRASPRQRLKRAAPGLALAALAAAAGLTLYLNAAHAHDWSAGGLASAAALPDQEVSSLTVLSLQSAAPRRIAVRLWERAASYFDLASGSWEQVPATPANAAALVRFLDDKSRASRFRGAAVSALGDTYAALWQPETAYRALESLGLPGGMPPRDAVAERVWLAGSAPITSENRARLEALSDPQAYLLPGHFAFLLSKAWLRFGNLKKAGQWRDAARAGGAEENELQDYAIPARPPLAFGVISGRVVVRGGRRASISVALTPLGDGETTAEPPVDESAALAGVTASTRVRDDGSFEFRRLSGGRYALHLLFDAKTVPPDAEAVKVSRNPGLIVLSRGRPQFEAGTIVVTVAPAARR